MNVAAADNIQGWMSIGELRFLAEHATDKKVILEAGSYKGRSTRAMADNTLSGIIHAIDPWDGLYDGLDLDTDIALQNYRKSQDNPKSIYAEFTTNLFDYIVTRKVIPHKTKFTKFSVPYTDMIFIDAIHTFDKAKADILHAINLMREGGLLCGHDYSGNWPGVINAVDDIFGPGIQTHESIWWIKL
jgi:hypothetical protein